MSGPLLQQYVNFFFLAGEQIVRACFASFAGSCVWWRRRWRAMLVALLLLVGQSGAKRSREPLAVFNPGLLYAISPCLFTPARVSNPADNLPADGICLVRL